MQCDTCVAACLLMSIAFFAMSETYVYCGMCTLNIRIVILHPLNFFVSICYTGSRMENYVQSAPPDPEVFV